MGILRKNVKIQTHKNLILSTTVTHKAGGSISFRCMGVVAFRRPKITWWNNGHKQNKKLEQIPSDPPHSIDKVT